jgi:hypothetical protein
VTDAAAWTAPTLDTLFRRSVERQPDTLALIDPSDKIRITGTAPRRLTYLEADKAISNIARHFQLAGLPAGSAVAIQLPNTIEFVLTLLGIWRAGLIAAPVPLLWRHADLVAALTRIGARALVVQDRVDGIDLATNALSVAADVFPIRHVCGFGPALPEEIVSIESTFASSASLFTPEPQPEGIVTFDVTPEGLMPVSRTHGQIIAGGLAIHLEAGPGHTRMLSTIPPSSFTGLSATVTCWLLNGGTLSLHHAFDADAMTAQLANDQCDTVVLPAPLALRLSHSGWPANNTTLRHVLALWRSPEHAGASADWESYGIGLTDIYCLGETGHIAARRSGSAIQPLRAGPRRAPHIKADAPLVAELRITPEGTLSLRGPMVPPVADVDGPASSIHATDTGYAVRRDPATDTFSITAPPAGIVAVGGYRFRANDIQDHSQMLGDDVTLAALPDRINGNRLVGRAANDDATRHAAGKQGLNALVVDAFRPRGETAQPESGERAAPSRQPG